MVASRDFNGVTATLTVKPKLPGFSTSGLSGTDISASADLVLSSNSTSRELSITSTSRQRAFACVRKRVRFLAWRRRARARALGRDGRRASRSATCAR